MELFTSRKRIMGRVKRDYISTVDANVMLVT
jgi:hypothetical protein